MSNTTTQQQTKAGLGCGLGCGALIVLFIIIGGLIGMATGAGDEPENGCSKILPAEDFRECVNREGIWTGIEDVE